MLVQSCAGVVAQRFCASALLRSYAYDFLLLLSADLQRSKVERLLFAD